MIVAGGGAGLIVAAALLEVRDERADGFRRNMRRPLELRERAAVERGGQRSQHIVG